jgi:hypothetical protein
MLTEIIFKQEGLDEYLKEVNKLLTPTPEPNWIFRGVSNKEHKLEVSLKWARTNKVGSPTASTLYSTNKELEMFDRFKRSSLSLGAFSGLGSPVSDLDWLCLARHHGLPCRILDWTESPLVASYFACMHMGAEGDAAVYAIQMPDLVTPKEAEQPPFEITSVKSYRPFVISPRIAVQSALITIHPRPMEEYTPDRGYKFIFPRALQGQVKHYLHRYGIHHQSLFPDLDGIARYIHWLYKWDRL